MMPDGYMAILAIVVLIVVVYLLLPAKHPHKEPAENTIDGKTLVSLPEQPLILPHNPSRRDRKPSLSNLREFYEDVASGKHEDEWVSESGLRAAAVRFLSQGREVSPCVV